MTRADQIKSALNNKTMDWAELLAEAENIGDAYEQDYDNELTYFELPDKSVAVFHGKTQEIFTYGCR